MTLVRCALAEVCIVPLLLVIISTLRIVFWSKSELGHVTKSEPVEHLFLDARCPYC